MVYSFGPYIPGKTSSSTPYIPGGYKPPTPSSSSSSESGTYIPGGYKPPVNTAAKTGVYIPAGAYKADGTAVSPLSMAMAKKINSRIAKPATNVTNGTKVVTKEDLGTGSIETSTAPVPGTTDDPAAGGASDEDLAQKPGEVTNEQEQLDAAQMAADALRKFQENVASQNLISALSKLDRGALDQYKGIANDYAARGMGRSGGKMIAEEKAKNEQEFVRDNAVQEVFNFITELSYGGNIEQAKTNLAKSDVFSEWLNTKYGGN